MHDKWQLKNSTTDSVDSYAQYIPVEANKHERLIPAFGFRKFTMANNEARMQRCGLKGVSDSSLVRRHALRRGFNSK